MFRRVVRRVGLKEVRVEGRPRYVVYYADVLEREKGVQKVNTLFIMCPHAPKLQLNHLFVFLIPEYEVQFGYGDEYIKLDIVGAF